MTPGCMSRDTTKRPFACVGLLEYTSGTLPYWAVYRASTHCCRMPALQVTDEFTYSHVLETVFIPKGLRPLPVSHTLITSCVTLHVRACSEQYD